MGVVRKRDVCVVAGADMLTVSMQADAAVGL